MFIAESIGSIHEFACHLHFRSWFLASRLRLQLTAYCIVIYMIMTAVSRNLFHNSISALSVFPSSAVFQSQFSHPEISAEVSYDFVNFQLCLFPCFILHRLLKQERPPPF
jgi:hypothetical protein